MTIDVTRPASLRSTHRAIGELVPAWDDALASVLADDTAAARRVVRGAEARRGSILLALAQTQRSADLLDASAVTDVTSMHVLAEAARMDRLLSDLCRSVVAMHADPLICEADGLPVSVLHRVGTARLEVLEGAATVPVIDRAFVQDTRALTGAARTLADGRCEHGRAATVCRDLATSLVEASRLATRC